MNERLSIDHLEVEGFRGVNRALTINLGPRATVFAAPNGRGKTSILGAIEWCLFGELRYQERENASHDELVNMQHHEGRARATITLRRSGEKYVVSRERKVGKRDSVLRITGPDGRSVSGEEAGAFLFRVTSLTYEDFFRAVFLHQESVRGLLLEEPRFRDEALDRLFGLEKLRDVLASIPMRDLTSAVKKIESKRHSLTERLSGAAGELERQRTRCLEEANELGLSEGELALTTAKALAQDVRLGMQRLSTELGVDVAKLPDIAGVEDIEKFARRAKELVRNTRTARGKSSPFEETTDRLVRIERARKDLESAQRDYEESSNVSTAFTKSIGSLKDLETKVDDLKHELVGWQERLRVLDIHARVVSDALLYFRSQTEVTSCPVCQQEITAPMLVRRLEKDIHEKQHEEIDLLTQKVSQGNETVRELGDALSQLKKLQTKMNDASQGVEELVARVQDLLGHPLGGATDAHEALQEEGKRVVAELEGFKDSQTRTQEDVQKIDGVVDQIRSVGKFLAAEEEFVKLRKKTPTGETGTEADSLQAEMDDLLELQESMGAIIQGVNAVATERARDAIERTRDEISEFYRTLCNHPYFDDLRIEISQKLSGGVQKNNYLIRASSSRESKSTLASSRLSVAQMNCVALSVYLAQSTVLAHSLGFLILDDPSQNLDIEHKVALASVLGRFATEQQVQLIVATHDVEFDKALQSSLRGDGVVVYSLSWSPRLGTQLTST